MHDVGEARISNRNPLADKIFLPTTEANLKCLGESNRSKASTICFLAN